MKLQAMKEKRQILESKKNEICTQIEELNEKIEKEEITNFLKTIKKSNISIEEATTIFLEKPDAQ